MDVSKSFSNTYGVPQIRSAYTAIPTETINDVVCRAYQMNPSPYTPNPTYVIGSEISQSVPMNFHQENSSSQMPDFTSDIPFSVAVGPTNHQSSEPTTLAPGYTPYISNATYTTLPVTRGGVPRGGDPSQYLSYRPSDVSLNTIIPTPSPAMSPVQDPIHKRGYVNPVPGSNGTSLQCHWIGCNERREFSRDTSLWRHIKAKHLYRGQFVCPVCGKQLDRPDSLQAHRRLNGHLDEK